MPGKYVAAFYGSVLLAGVLLFNARASEGVGPDSVVGWAVGTLCALYLMYLFIICCFRRGIDGPNKYGPDPLEESPAIWVYVSSYIGVLREVEGVLSIRQDFNSSL